MTAMPAHLPREVLIVEDEPITRIVAADAMADLGIMAWEAEDATEAFQMLHDHPRIGLLFTDVVVPGEMDGLLLAERVSNSRPDIQVIVTSGAVAVGDTELPDGGTFLPKPYRTDHLMRVVTEKLDGPSER